MYLYILPIHVHLYSVCMMIHEIRYTAIHLYRDIGTKFQKDDATPVQRIPLEATKNRAANPIAADTTIPLWVTMTWSVPFQQLGDIAAPNPTKPSSRPSHMEPLCILKTSWPLKIAVEVLFTIFSKTTSQGILVVSCCFRSFHLRFFPRISWARNSKNPVQLGTPFPSTCCDRHDASDGVSGLVAQLTASGALLVRPKCISTRLGFSAVVEGCGDIICFWQRTPWGPGLPSKSSKMSVLI